jgi:hypothetical protein
MSETTLCTYDDGLDVDGLGEKEEKKITSARDEISGIDLSNLPHCFNLPHYHSIFFPFASANFLIRE